MKKQKLDVDRITVSVGQLPEILDTAIRAGVMVGVEGASGMGKTACFRQAAERNGRKLCDLTASVMDPSADVCMAFADRESGFLNFHHNKGLPFVGTEDIWMQNGRPPALFIDELPNAPSAVISMWQKLIHDKGINGRPLIPGTWIGWAGNRAMDNAGVNRIPFPFLNRTVLVSLTHDLEAFVTYCNQNDVNEFVPAFLKQRPELLSYELLTRDTTEGERAVDLSIPQPSERAWAEMVGPILDHFSTASHRLVMLSGAVGDGPAREMETFFELRFDMPDIDRILAGEPEERPKNISTCYVVVSALVRRVTRENIKNCFAYLKRMDPEFSTLFASEVGRKDRRLASTQAYTEWAVANGNKLI